MLTKKLKKSHGLPRRGALIFKGALNSLGLKPPTLVHRLISGGSRHAANAQNLARLA